MRTQEEVLAKFESLRDNLLSKRKELFLSREHKNCCFNIGRRIRGHGKCCFCINDEILRRANGGPFVCDDEGTAKKCKFFVCRNSPESVESDFEEILRSPAQCGNEYPKLAILIWFLQDSSSKSRVLRFRLALLDIFHSLRRFIFFRWF
jgi:hypothetical protein